MKSRYKLILSLTMAMTGMLTSCSDDDSNLPNNGQPWINYVRVTDPAASDSLLVTATQGSSIAIIGQNLQNTYQVWFNDRMAELLPVYVTGTSILTSVPTRIPTVVTNKMTLVMSDGDTLQHDFVIDISEPVIESMKSEYVLTGETALIRGNYLYEPMTVAFTGGVVGEVVAISDNARTLEVIVPEGAESGPITITTNFGEAVSDFWFRDNRNIFLSSDPFTGWWNESFVVTNPEGDDPVAINGNYIRVNKLIGAWAWTEVAGGDPAAMGEISKNIPDEAILNPSDYYLKFEVNTLLPFNNNVLKINLGLSDGFYDDAYQWMPPYDTQGEWETVVIPLETVMADFTTSVSENGYHTRLLFHGPGELDADISMDNFRVVPKALD